MREAEVCSLSATHDTKEQHFSGRLFFTVNLMLIKAVQLKAGGTEHKGFSSFSAYSLSHTNNKTSMLIQACTFLKATLLNCAKRVVQLGLN